MTTTVLSEPIALDSATVDELTSIRTTPNELISQFSVSRHLDSGEAAIQILKTYADVTKLQFLCIDVGDGEVLAKQPADSLAVLPDDVLDEIRNTGKLALVERSSGLIFYSLPLPNVGGTRTAAVGYVFSNADAQPPEVILQAAEENWTQEQLNDWFADAPHCSVHVLQTLLELAEKSVRGDTHTVALENENEQLAAQIERTYEEISLLHSLTQNCQLSRPLRELAELCLARLPSLIPAAGSVFWLEEKGRESHCLVEGEIPCDEVGLAQLIARFETHDWSRPLVKNYVESTLLGADFPELRNFVIVSVREGTHRSGWMLSFNLADGREFGSIEANLLNSIATIFGTHARNIELYAEHEELLLSFVRSFVSTLDAKDPYTRGHSERVALIARRLGEEFHLPEEDLHDIYLSGLLHDIGKIGVDDRILRKPGQLTDEEFRQIQEHPMIGYSILAGLKNLRKVLPGVRNHHEAYNGKGYPDGLKGEEIPFMARILAVADSYDAMGSDRPYRRGMELEIMENIFHRGAGDQWDSRVIDAYFSAREDIRRICEDYQPSNGNLLSTSEGSTSNV